MTMAAHLFLDSRLKYHKTMEPTYQLFYEGSTNPFLKTYKFQGLTAGSLYSFIVYARNDKEYSLASPALEVIAATMPPKMSSPRVLSVDDSTQSVTLE